MKEDYEFEILFDLHKEKILDSGEPEWVLKKKNCSRKWYVTDLYNITDVREVPTQTGKPYKSKCEVFHKNEGKWVVIKGSYESILNIIRPNERKKVIGYGI